MRVTRAVYRGHDTKGDPFQLEAESAVQATSAYYFLDNCRVVLVAARGAAL